MGLEWKQDSVQAIQDTKQAKERRLASLEQQTTDAQIALVEAYEQSDRQNTDLLLAATELFESLLALGERITALEGGAKNG